ncbi:MAG: GTP-binding protein [Candidatus Odinarchaeota archaeon]
MIKIALVGDGGVGKTALREMFAGKTFHSSYNVTIGADFAIHEILVDGHAVKFQCWDLAGQKRFSQVRSSFYLGVMGCLLVYDVTRKETFENTPLWLKEVFKYSGHGQVPVVLLGNKSDLRDETPFPLMPKHGQALAGEISSILEKNSMKCNYFDTSAKTGKNVAAAFIELGRSILEYEKSQRTPTFRKVGLSSVS